MKFRGRNFIGSVETLDAFSEELNCLDDLGGGGSNGVEVDDLMFAFKEDLGRV